MGSKISKHKTQKAGQCPSMYCQGAQGSCNYQNLNIYGSSLWNKLLCSLKPIVSSVTPTFLW